MKIAISEIIIGPRHRKDLGDIKALAESIDSIGLMQPIGITKDNVLVFGERRLIACRDHLGWKMIDYRIVDVPSIVDGEYAENEIRKKFTPSERVAIKQAIKDEIGERRGRPGKECSNEHQFKDGVKTSEIAAEKAGFPSEMTSRRAEAVVRKGIPEVVEAMDKGQISVTKAAEIAKLKPEMQSRALAQEKGREQQAHHERRCSPAKELKPPIATEAMQLAVVAITQLERIRHNDPCKVDALQRVIKWCEKNMRARE